MRLLYIEISIPPYYGGIERVTWTNSKFLESLGNEVFYAFSLHDSDEVDSIHKFKIDYSQNLVSFKSNLLRFIIDHKIDVVINQDLYNKKIRKALIEIKKRKICKIVHCFHLSPDYLDNSPLIKKTKKHLIKDFVLKIFTGLDSLSYEKKRMYKLSDKFVLLSESFIENFKKRYKLPDVKKMYAISNPLSFPDECKIEDLQKKKIVLIISRFFEQQKNICSALRIWNYVENDTQNDWQLVIAGYGQDEDFIKGYAEKLGLKRVRFIGRVSNPIKLYKESSIFMMTSRYEGFGMTLTEASQFGCIPFAFDNFTALYDIIENQVNGFIIPSNDEERYYGQMKMIMEDKFTREVIAQNAIINSQRFSVEIIGRRWQVLFESLIKG